MSHHRKYPVYADHAEIVQALYSILDQATTEYDVETEGVRGVVEDFTRYVQDWANRWEHGGRNP